MEILDYTQEGNFMLRDEFFYFLKDHCIEEDMMGAFLEDLEREEAIVRCQIKWIAKQKKSVLLRTIGHCGLKVAFENVLFFIDLLFCVSGKFQMDATFDFNLSWVVNSDCLLSQLFLELISLFSFLVNDFVVTELTFGDTSINRTSNHLNDACKTSTRNVHIYSQISLILGTWTSLGHQLNVSKMPLIMIFFGFPSIA